MKKYEYLGYRPYGAGEMFCLDSYVDPDYDGNVTKEVIRSGGFFRILPNNEAEMYIADEGITINFVKESTYNDK